MTMIDRQERQARGREQAEGVAALEASGVLDDLYAKIDAGQVKLEGRDGLIQQLIKAGLERGLQAELDGHLGYEKGAPDASIHANSRNGFFPKTVSTSVGDVQLAIPRDRDGSFTPMLIPKGQRRVGGLDDMIISLYAGGMTIRDIEHHLVTTVGTEISRGNDLEDHGRGPRRGYCLAAAASGLVLSSDLSRRVGRESPGWRAREE
jgi:hypothetical protein